MKVTLLFYIVVSTLSCSLYESEARVFLRERAFSGPITQAVGLSINQKLNQTENLIEHCYFTQQIENSDHPPLTPPTEWQNFNILSFYKKQFFSYYWVEEFEAYLYCQSYFVEKEKNELRYYDSLKDIIEEHNL